MSPRITVPALLAGALLVLTAAARGAEAPIGRWLTADGNGVIAIEPCGAALCGRIVGSNRPADAPMPTDRGGRPECGLTILTTDAQPTADGAWNGRIIDPRNGTAYHARLWLDDGGTLHLRGYVAVPLLGQTQIWHRYAGQLTPDCRMLAPASVERAPPMRGQPRP